MKIIITERQYKELISEETTGVDSFFGNITNSFLSGVEEDIIKELKFDIQRVFDETGTKNIKFDTFRIPADGLSTPDGVILNSKILQYNFYRFLFILFHELAHQYQYKKYGDKIMLDVYFDEMNLEDAAKFMLDVEHVADEYGVRKLKQIIRRGLIPDSLSINKPNESQIAGYKGYKNVSTNYLGMLINGLREKMRKNNITDHEQVSEFMYNFIKGKI